MKMLRLKNLLAGALFIMIYLSHYDYADGCILGVGKNLGYMTRDKEFLVGSSPKFYCNLNANQTEFDCTDLAIVFKNERVNSKCLNSTTLEFSLQNANVDKSGMYHCKIMKNGQNLYVCAASYNFGTEPQNVTDFQCISEGFQNLTCSWKPVPNKVKTTYTIAVSFGLLIVQNMDTARSCPSQHTKPVSCMWGMDTNPLYHRNVDFITFLLTGNNTFGTNTQYFRINTSEIIRAGVPVDFRLDEIGKSFASFIWKHPLYMPPTLTPPMIYEVNYKNEFEDFWRVLNLTNEALINSKINNDEYKIELDLIPNTNYIVKIRCRVQDSIDLWSPFATLNVKTQPDIPYSVPSIIPQSFMVVNSGYRDVVIYWQGIERKHCNGDDCGYFIKVIPITAKKRRRRSIENSAIRLRNYTLDAFDQTTLRIEGLNKDVDYECVIRAKNTLGSSEGFAKILIPSNDKLPRKPRELRASSGKEGYFLEWDAPEHEDSNKISYTVAWCENKQPRPYPCTGRINWLNDSLTERSVVLKLPDNEYIYQFAVASNNDRFSSGLEWVPCVVPFDKVLDKIRHINVARGNDPRSLKVSWNLDCFGQANTVRYYTVAYRECPHSCNRIQNRHFCERELFYRNFSQSAMSNEVQVNGLKPFSHYLVSVAATNDKGTSEYSDEVCQQTPPGEPSAPVDVTYGSVTSNSAILHWEKPIEPNGVITSYKILLNDKAVQEVGHKQSYVLKNLTSYLNYSVAVEACVSNLCGNLSSPVSFMTKISTPGRMATPRYSMRNASTADIQWDPPAMPNGPIDYYVMHIRPENDRNSSVSEGTEVTEMTGDTTNKTVDFPCDPEEPERPFMVSIQAVNVVDGQRLEGPISYPMKVTCLPFKDETMGPLTIGLIVGVVLGFIVLIVILYSLVNWMKGKVEKMRNITADLPEGLNSPQSKPLSTYENFKNGLINNPDLSPKPAYGRLDSFMSEEDSFKNRHGSGTSQFSATSTDELITKQQNIVAEKAKRNPSGDSSGCGSTGGHDSLSSSLTHRTNLSSDSGNEADLKHPPSLEVAVRDGEIKDQPSKPDGEVDVSRVSGSKDSGVDKGDDSDEKSKSPVSPYSQFSSYVDSSNKALGSYSPQTPYSKFGMEQSCYVPYSRGRNMNLYGHNLANSEPSINEMDEGNYSCIGAEQRMVGTILDSQAAGQYSKLGLSRSIHDVLGWRDYSGDGDESPEIKNGKHEEGNGVVLPYSRFGIRRVESPTTKNNPYITVGMAFSMVDKDPNEILKQKRQQVPWLPDIATITSGGKTTPLSNDAKIPPPPPPLQDDMVVLQPNDQAYSKFGMGNGDYVMANKNTLPTLTLPGEGYVGYDDMKIVPISKMVSDLENFRAEVEDLNAESTDYGSDSIESHGIAPYSCFLTSSLKEPPDEVHVEDTPEPFSLTLSDNIYAPPSYDDLKEIVSPAKSPTPSSSVTPPPLSSVSNGYVSTEAMTRIANSVSSENDRTLPLSKTIKTSGVPHELLPTISSSSGGSELKESISHAHSTNLPDVNIKRSNGYVTLGELPSVCGSGGCGKEEARYNIPITDV